MQLLRHFVEALVVLCHLLVATRAQDNLIEEIGGITFYPINKSISSLYLGGLFPITTADVVQNKGLQRAEAFRCAMTIWNNSFISGVRLFYHIEDDQDDGNVALSKSLKLLENLPIAIIGPSSSSVTDVVARLVASFNLPAISYASSSASLSSLTTYPTLLRTVPSDNLQVEAMVKICLRFGWSLVASVGTSDTYGFGGAEAFTVAASNAGIEVLCPYILSPTGNMDDFFTCIQLSQTKVIMLFCSEANAVAFITRFKQTSWWSSDYTFIASDSWPTANVANLLQASTVGSGVIKGSLGVIQNPGNVTQFKNWWYALTPSTARYSFFNSYWQSRFSCELTNNTYVQLCPSMTSGIAARNFTCLCDGTESLNGDSINNKVALVMDATKTALFSLQQLLHNCSAYANLSFTDPKICTSNNISYADLLIMMRNIKFYGYTGSVSFNGIDRSNPVYDILQFNGSVWITVGSYVAGDDKLSLTNSLLTWGTSSGSVPFSQVVPNFVSTDEPASIVVYLLAAIGILVSLVLIVYFYKHRHHRVVRKSSPTFCMLTLSGNIFIYLSLYLWSGPPSEGLCVTKFWFMLIGFALMMGNLLAPTYRIYRIFTQGLRFKKMMTKDLLIMSSLIVAGEVILLTVWTAVDPVYPQLQTSSLSVYYTYYQCNGSNSTFQTVMLWLFIVYNALLLVAGCLLSYLTRKVYAEYNDSLLIAFAMYNLSFCMAIMLPIYMTTTDSTGSDLRRYIIRSLTILFGNTVTVAILFGPKVRSIHLNLKNESKSDFSNSTGAGTGTTGSMIRGIPGGQFKPKIATVIDEKNKILGGAVSADVPRTQKVVKIDQPSTSTGPNSPTSPTSATCPTSPTSPSSPTSPASPTSPSAYSNPFASTSNLSSPTRTNDAPSECDSPVPLLQNNR